MNKDEISVIVHNIVASTFNPHNNANLTKQIGNHAISLTMLTESSLKLVALCMDFEEALGVEIELADLLDNPSIDAFSSHIAVRIASGK